MTKESRKSSTRTRRQTAKSPEPLAEHDPDVVRFIAVRPKSAEKWKAHRLEKVQRTKAAEKWKAYRSENVRRSKAAQSAAATPEPRKQKRAWQIDRIRGLLPIAYPPDGRVPSNATYKVVLARLKPLFEEKGWKVPLYDSIARALGRRDRRG